MSVNILGFQSLVEKAARVAHDKYPSFHDVDDTKQTLWLWLYENRETVEGIVRDTKRREHENKPVFDLLVRVANAHLNGEDAARHGYSEEDAYYYSTDLIKEILEVVFQHEDWQSFATVIDMMPKGKSDPATAGNNLASYVDVSRAIDQLKTDQYNLIVWRYKYEYTFEMIGHELGITRQAAQQRHEVAVRAIQRTLGRRDLGELRKGSEPQLRPDGTADAIAQTDRTYNG